MLSSSGAGGLEIVHVFVFRAIAAARDRTHAAAHLGIIHHALSTGLFACV